MEICLKKKLYPKDIISTAKSLARGDSKKYRAETRRITKDQIREKARDIRVAKENWNKSTRERKTSLKLSMNGEEANKHFKQSELSRAWDFTIDRLKNKIDHWERTQNPEREEFSQKVEGILISDRLLKERF